MISENGWACLEKLSPATLKDFIVERMGEKQENRVWIFSVQRNGDAAGSHYGNQEYRRWRDQNNSGYPFQGGSVSKVIVVDDEPFILMMIEDKLRKTNIHVITLRESRKAFDVIKKERPNLVILDWMMPELSGIDLCKMIKNDPDIADIPVFMLTAKGQESDEVLGLQCGAARYITKPFSPKSLLELIQETVGSA